MASKKSKKNNVKTSQACGSNEQTGLSSEERPKNTVLNQPEVTGTRAIDESGEIVKQERESQKTDKEPLHDRDEQVETTKEPSQKEGQKIDKEPLNGPDEQVETTKEPSQQQNETRRTKKDLQENDQEQIQETKESSFSPLQSTEGSNQVVRRRGVGQAPDDKGMKRKNETRQMDEAPVENIDVEQETNKDSTLVSDQSTGEKNPSGKQENVENEPISPPSTWMIVAVLLLIFMVILLFPPEPVKKDKKTVPDLTTSINHKIILLKSLFSNQSENFWNSFRMSTFFHLKGAYPGQAFVLLVAVPPSARDVVTCMVKKLAQVFDPNHKGDFTIDGLEEMNNPWEKVKRKIDDSLKEKFEAGHKVALVNHLELFPIPSHMMFHAYCDDQFAPYTKVAIILTVFMPNEADFPLSSYKEVNKAISKYLVDEVWVKEDPGATYALYVRVSQTVVFMNGESSDSIKAACPLGKNYNESVKN